MRKLATSSLLLLLLADIALAADPPTDNSPPSQSADELKEGARSVWDAWRTEREKLQTGRFRATGEATYLQRKKADGVTQIVDRQTVAIDCRAAFDWPASSKKYNFSTWGPLVTGLWAETDAQLIEWPGKKGTVAVIKASDSERLYWARLIDPRVVGYASSSQMNDCRLSFAKALERIEALPEPLDVRKLENGRVELVYDVPYAGSTLWCRTSYVFNESRGFTIESHRKVNHREGLEVPILNATCQWKKHQDVWIPTALDYYGRQSLYKIKLNFEWESVNEPILPQEFEISNLGIPDGTTVSDKRFDVPILYRLPIDENRD